MLCLSGRDIMEAASCDGVMDEVERILVAHERGEYYMPPRVHLDHGANTLLLMPCFGSDAFGTKLVTVFPDNAEKGLPVVDGVVVLNDADTGRPVALLNGQVLTGLRTGAVGGVSIRHLAPRGARAAGIVGAGVQGHYQALFAQAAMDLSDLYVYDISAERVSRFASDIAEKLPGVRVHPVDQVDDLLRESQVVVTATTSDEPVIPGASGNLRGKHFVAVGSFKPTMRELPEALFREIGGLFIDTEHALEESGDARDPLEQGWISRDRIRTLGNLLEEGTESGLRDETTVFKTVGMAAFDLGVSRLIYEAACASGVGQRVQL